MSALIVINSVTEISYAAKQLVQLFGDAKIIAFSGAMAAGKTTLIKAICEELGVKETISSPTFSLVNEYHTSSGQTIYHFDFYRINSINEAYDIGYEDYFYSGNYCFIEWPEKITELLPPDNLKVNITVNNEQRVIEIGNLVGS